MSTTQSNTVMELGYLMEEQIRITQNNVIIERMFKRNTNRLAEIESRRNQLSKGS